MADFAVATVVIDTEALKSLEHSLRSEMAAITRDFAAHEAGPVGERLRQIADAFEGVA